VETTDHQAAVASADPQLALPAASARVKQKQGGGRFRTAEERVLRRAHLRRYKVRCNELVCAVLRRP
jgi:hypothetical protein